MKGRCLLPSLFLLVLATSALALDLTSLQDSGTFEQPVTNAVPDANGRLASEKLELPDYRRGVYYSPIVTHQAIGNRFYGVEFTHLSHLRQQRAKLQAKQPWPDCDMGSFLCLKIDDTRYLALLALAGEDVFSTFTLRGDGLYIDVLTGGTAPYSGLKPHLSYAFGETPQEASLKAWAAALNSNTVQHSTVLRGEKRLPEPFAYLGYCTWEHLRRNLKTEVLVRILQQMNNGNLPFRWMLIDDGYESTEQQKLTRFEPHPAKFKNGFKPLTDLKKTSGVRWLGLWWHMGGYFDGISPQHTIEALDDHLMSLTDGQLAPRSTQASADAFYHARADAMAEAGIDFIKVDFQTRFFRAYRGQPNPVQSFSTNHRALESAADKHFQGMLNCIAQHHLHVFKQRKSATIRSSIDYVKGDPENHAFVNLQSLRNTLYLGMVHWCDYDMFLSSLPTGRLMAEIRALAGSPLYVSEAMEKVNPECIRPAIWCDGEVIRPLAPATLTPEGFFTNPAKLVLRAVAPLEGQVASFWLANLQSTEPAQATLSPGDYRFGGIMIQPYEGLWEMPPEGLVVFDRNEGKAWRMMNDFKVTLPRWESRIVHLIPVQDGWAVIGRPDKYLSPATGRRKKSSPNEIRIELKESGPFLIWLETGTPVVKGAKVTRQNPQLYRIDLPDTDQPVHCVVQRIE